VFTDLDAFDLYKVMEEGKVPAPIKAGAVAPHDIVVEQGPTSLKPGPIVGELQNLGIPAGISGGKVEIKQQKVAVKEGEKVSAPLAEMLAKLEIYPVTEGLDLREVGPCSTTMSCGATAPAFIGAGIFPSSITLYKSKASKSVNTNAVWSSTKSARSVIPLSFIEVEIKLFFDTRSLALSVFRNSFRIRCNCFAPNPLIFATPIVLLALIESFMLKTCPCFHAIARFTFFFISLHYPSLSLLSHI